MCERFRREMIKQSSIPNYISNWSLFTKFAALKDAQTSDDRKFRIKTEETFEHDVIDFAALIAAASTSTNSTNSRKRKSNCSTSPTNGCNDNNDLFLNETNGNDHHTTNNDRYSKLPKIFDGRSIEDDNDTQSMHVEPCFVGGSTDLSTDSIAAFCQFVEASLKQMSTDRSDELIEDISSLLFRKKREFKLIDSTNDSIATPPSS